MLRFADLFSRNILLQSSLEEQPFIPTAARDTHCTKPLCLYVSRHKRAESLQFTDPHRTAQAGTLNNTQKVEPWEEHWSYIEYVQYRNQSPETLSLKPETILTRSPEPRASVDSFCKMPWPLQPPPHRHWDGPFTRIDV